MIRSRFATVPGVGACNARRRVDPRNPAENRDRPGKRGTKGNDLTRTHLALLAKLAGRACLLPFPRLCANVPSGNAGTYSVLAGSQLTNTGATTISGDVV